MWRFVHLSDPHLGSNTDGQWNNRFLCTMMPDVMRCLKSDLAKLDPDFLLITGDIVSEQSCDAFFAARDLLDSLEIPYYPVGGNHDFLHQRNRKWFRQAFDLRLPGGDTVYSFTHKDLHFCILDPWWRWRDGSLQPYSEPREDLSAGASYAGVWVVPPHQLAWLEDDLARNSDVPTILAMHYPAVPIPERLQRADLKDAGHLEETEALFDLLGRNRQVMVVLSGHVHMNFIERRDGIAHVATSSLPEFPTEYREIVVKRDRLAISTCQLSDSTFAARSLIDGKTFTAGQPEDRQAEVALRPV